MSSDPNDKRAWTCDKCGAEVVGSEKHIFSDEIMTWYRHGGGTDDDGNARAELILCGFCEPLAAQEEAA